MVDKLIDTVPYLAVLFCTFLLSLSWFFIEFFRTASKFFILFFTDDKDDKQDIRILNELENIDDDLEREEIVIVRIDNDAEAKEYGIDHLPTLVYFENKIPALYEGIIDHIVVVELKPCKSKEWNFTRDAKNFSKREENSMSWDFYMKISKLKNIRPILGKH